MNRLSLHFVIVVFFGLVPSVLNAQSETQSPREVARRFCKVHNADSFEDLIPLLTPKTKATMMMSHVISTGTAPKPRQDFYREFGEKWWPKIEAFIESESIDVASSSRWAAINKFSDWPLLDDYLTELMLMDRPALGPTYSIEGDITTNESHAKGTIQLRTHGGFLDGLGGNSIESIDAGTIDIYLIKLSDKWMVCHEYEYNGEMEPANPDNSK